MGLLTELRLLECNGFASRTAARHLSEIRLRRTEDVAGGGRALPVPIHRAEVHRTVPSGAFFVTHQGFQFFGGFQPAASACFAHSGQGTLLSYSDSADFSAAFIAARNLLHVASDSNS